MDKSLDELYQQRILDHFKHPRNREAIPADLLAVKKHNPTCGDEIQVALTDRRIIYEVKACAICVASASMMAEGISGKPAGEMEAAARRFLTVFDSDEVVAEEEFGELAAMESVKRYPMRMKCATLGWLALLELLKTPG